MNRCVRHGPFDFGAEIGNRTLNLGIMIAELSNVVSVVSVTYRVAPIALGTTEHKEARPSHTKLAREFPRRLPDSIYAAADESTTEPREISRSAEM